MDATNNEDDPTLSSDGLELYYAVQVPPNDKNLYVMTRASRSDPFGTPVPLTAFNTAGTDEGPRLSYDDLTIYFGQNGDIFTSTRTTTPLASYFCMTRWVSETICFDTSVLLVHVPPMST